MASFQNSRSYEPWNKRKLIGQKAPLRLKDIWAIRVRLQLDHKIRDLALFNLAIDSKLRACDLVKLRVSDISHAIESHVRSQGRYGILEDYTGHGIGTEMHMPPNVPNYGRRGRGRMDLRARPRGRLRPARRRDRAGGSRPGP